MRRGFERANRVGSEIKRLIAEIIERDLKDPALENGVVISIIAVNLTKDLKNATVHLSIFEPNRHEEAPSRSAATAKSDALKALNRARGYIRRLIGERMKLRVLPELFFKEDHSIERSARIDEILKDIDHD